MGLIRLLLSSVLLGSVASLSSAQGPPQNPGVTFSFFGDQPTNVHIVGSYTIWLSNTTMLVGMGPSSLPNLMFPTALILRWSFIAPDAGYSIYLTKAQTGHSSVTSMVLDSRGILHVACTDFNSAATNKGFLFRVNTTAATPTLHTFRSAVVLPLLGSGAALDAQMPLALAVDSADNIYISISGALPHILRVPGGQALTAPADLTTSLPLSVYLNPNALGLGTGFLVSQFFFDKENNMWSIIDTTVQANQVFKIVSDNATNPTVAISQKAINPQLTNIDGHFGGIALDSNGFMYLSQNTQVHRIKFPELTAVPGVGLFGQWTSASNSVLRLSVSPGGQYLVMPWTYDRQLLVAFILNTSTCSLTAPIGGTLGRCSTKHSSLFPCSMHCNGATDYLNPPITYCNAGVTVGQPTCDQCPGGGICFNGRVLSLCGVGTFSPVGVSLCSSCPSGSFQDRTGQETCQSCTPGRFSNAVGANSSATCQACPPGSACTGGHAVPCAVGSYRTEPATDSCLPCPAGYICPHLGTIFPISVTCPSLVLPSGVFTVLVIPTQIGSIAQLKRNCSALSHSTITQAMCALAADDTFQWNTAVLPECIQEDINCELTGWSDSETCSKDCGGGLQKQTRTVITPQHGLGTSCEALCTIPGADCDYLTQFVPCNTWSCSCPDIVAPPDASILSQTGPLNAVNSVTTFTHSPPCTMGFHSSETSSRCVANFLGQRYWTDAESPACVIDPVDCVLSDWIPLGSCSRTCGTGVQLEMKDVAIPRVGTGAECSIEPYDLSRQVPCATQECTCDSFDVGLSNMEIVAYSQPQHQEHSTVTLKVHMCAEGFSSNTVEAVCTIRADLYMEWILPVSPACIENPVDCVYEWVNDGGCTLECGGGTQLQRTHVIVPARGSGNSCPNPSVRTVPCHTQSCVCGTPITILGASFKDPSAAASFENPPGTIVEYIKESGCPAGFSSSVVLAICSVDASNTRYWSLPSSSPECFELPVSCVVGDWLPGSSCDATCGGGHLSEIRTVTEARAGGLACTDEQRVTVRYFDCNTQSCSCEDYVPAAIYQVSSYSHAPHVEGSSAVLRVRECPPASLSNTATAMCAGGAGGQLHWVPPNPLPECILEPVNCQWGDWTNSGTCTTLCGGGQQKQTRTIRTQAQGGGQPCSGSDTQYINCNSQPCLCPNIVVPAGLALSPSAPPSNLPLNTEGSMQMLIKVGCAAGFTSSFIVAVCNRPSPADTPRWVFPSSQPSCIPNACAPIATPVHGSVTNGGTGNTGSVVSFSCAAGYVLSNAPSSFTCGSGGLFSNGPFVSPPVCVQWECATLVHLDPPSNGYLTFTDSTITFHCTDGRTPLGQHLTYRWNNKCKITPADAVHAMPTCRSPQET